MTFRLKALFCGIALAFPPLSAAPAAYAGGRACKACHASTFTTQSASAHAKALARAADLRNLPSGVKFSRGPQYRFEVLRAEDGLRVHIDNGTDLMDLPLEWAFGSGRQAITFVSRIDRDWYIEHFGTWYSSTNAYGPTPGHDAHRPVTINEAAGALYGTNDNTSGIKGCFECHSTGPVMFAPNGDAKIGEPGVHCESCHGPGSEHAASPAQRTLNNPGKLPAVDLNRFCGACHRAPAASGVRIDFDYAWNVRHEPVYLSQSACFLKSHGGLSCLTCHDPHEASSQKPASFFNNKCLACHAGASKLHQTVTFFQKGGDCIDCHMPVVSPQSNLRFTNHWIGIYAGGANLKPVRSKALIQ